MWTKRVIHILDHAVKAAKTLMTRGPKTGMLEALLTL